MTIDSADDSKISNRTITTNRISNRTYDSKSNRITKLRRSIVKITFSGSVTLPFPFVRSNRIAFYFFRCRSIAARETRRPAHWASRTIDSSTRLFADMKRYYGNGATERHHTVRHGLDPSMDFIGLDWIGLGQDFRRLYGLNWIGSYNCDPLFFSFIYFPY